MPKTMITINAMTDTHYKFARHSLAGAVYKAAISIRQGQGAIIVDVIDGRGQRAGKYGLDNAVKQIHRQTNVRLKTRPDPYKIAAALMQRLPNAPKPKSDATSD
jgi:hypothetical protein